MAGTSETNRDAIHHVALAVRDIAEAAKWYIDRFGCEIRYQDETWALLAFANIQLALVIPSQHPPHISFTSPRAAEFGPLKRHRDGTASTYVTDPSGNTIEVMAEESAPVEGTG